MLLALGSLQTKTFAAAVDHLRTRGHDVMTFDSDDILTMSVDDVISGDESVVRWTCRGQSLSSDRIQGVLNVLEGIAPDSFRVFAEEDRDYARRELHSYLTNASRRFVNVINPTAFHALSGTTASLLDQWRTATANGLRIPRHHYGRGASPASLDTARIIVAQNTSQLRSWRPTGAVATDCESYRLTVERPLGRPIIATFLDDAAWIADGTADATLSAGVGAMAAALQARHGLRMGTMVFFLDGTALTFGGASVGINIDYLRGRARRDFLERLERGLTRIA